MKKIIAGSMICLMALSTHALDYRSIVDDVLQDATRKSSCTYRLKIIGVTKDRVEPIKRKGTSRANACANAKIACSKKGEKEGFFGRHICKKLDSDDGGIIRQVLTGTYQTNQASRADLIKHIEHLEVELSEKSKTIAKLKKDRSVLAVEIDNSPYLSTFDIELKGLKREVLDLKNKNKKLQKSYDDLNNTGKKPQDVVSLIKSCDSETNSVDSMHECVQRVKEGENLKEKHLRHCSRATVNDTEFFKCLDVVEETNVAIPFISECEDATSDFMVAGLNCMTKMKGYAPKQGKALIKQCSRSSRTDEEFSKCLDLYL
jgi:DNA-binding protein YbaB